MSSYILLLRPRDPVIFRDARPFTADPGARARTLPWPLPQTVAGALRSHIGDTARFDWRRDDVRRQARSIRVQGPLPVARRTGETTWTVYLPAPRDAVLYDKEEASGNTRERIFPLRPLAALLKGGGCDIEDGLLPIGMNEAEAFKPKDGPLFWSLRDTVRWLRERAWEELPEHILGGLPTDTRTHVAVDRATRTAISGRLFSTTALVFNDAPWPVPKGGSNDERPEVAMLCRVSGTPATWAADTATIPLGGERRGTDLMPETQEDLRTLWHTPPVELLEALVGATAFRLQLATPALFTTGWRPDNDHKKDEPYTQIPTENADDRWGFLPGLQETGLGLQLVSAVIGRPVAVSGWNLSGHRPQNSTTAATPGPKATRYAAPAGSVYFFTANRALTERDVENLWLRAISGQHQDRLNGYGLAMPGVWERRGNGAHGAA